MNASGFTIKPEEQKFMQSWISQLGKAVSDASVKIESLRQDWDGLHYGESILKQPLSLKGKTYSWGLGSHANSEIRIYCSEPIKKFTAFVGVDYNECTVKCKSKVVFTVESDGKSLWKSKGLSVDEEPEKAVIFLKGIQELILKAEAENNKISLTHSDWAEAEIETTSGKVLHIGTKIIGAQRFCGSLPISFKYGGRKSSELLREWGIECVTENAPDSKYIYHRLCSKDQNTGLECHFTVKEYRDFPACLWNVHFKNSSTKNSLILEDIQSLDLDWTTERSAVLHRSRGSFNIPDTDVHWKSFMENFLNSSEKLSYGQKLQMSAFWGRSSADWMPYFNLQTESDGLITGIGWTGQWKVEIESKGGGIINLKAGMEKTCLKLYPEEEISLPSIFLLYWQGDNHLRGHNLLRRFMTTHIMPHYNGEPVQAPICHAAWGGMSAAGHIERINNQVKQRLPYDYYWIDAGWYGPKGTISPDVFDQSWAMHTGQWNVNPSIYPNGLKVVSDAVHQAGMKFLLWVEPERAIKGTPITLKHPEWFLGAEYHKNLLLNLGNPLAWQWVVELISNLISENGIDCYRQDFNVHFPLILWRENDEPDRIGMTEIRHVEGLYAFLDELRRRYPDLLIDNCASGGRRLDFEMMSRSIPLWISDMQCDKDFDPDGSQIQIHGLSYWIPQNGTRTSSRPGDTYNFRSAMSAGISFTLFPAESLPIDPDYPYDWHREMMMHYHRAKKYFQGDFYPLTENSTSDKIWNVLQFHRPDLDEGIIIAFRRKNSPFEKAAFPLSGLVDANFYEFEDADSRNIIQMKGKKLIEEGFPVGIDKRKSSRLYFYHIKDDK